MTSSIRFNVQCSTSISGSGPILLTHSYESLLMIKTLSLVHHLRSEENISRCFTLPSWLSNCLQGLLNRCHQRTCKIYATRRNVSTGSTRRQWREKCCLLSEKRNTKKCEEWTTLKLKSCIWLIQISTSRHSYCTSRRTTLPSRTTTNYCKQTWTSTTITRWCPSHS